MAVSVFDEKAFIPDDEMVAAALAGTQPLWQELKNHVQATYPDITSEWKFYGKSAGWTLKLISKKRNLLFFVPKNNTFMIRIVLGERAVACVETADLPDDVKETIRNATPYVEGRGIDMNIDRPEQLESIKTLLKIKYEH